MELTNDQKAELQKRLAAATTDEQRSELAISYLAEVQGAIVKEDRVLTLSNDQLKQIIDSSTSNAQKAIKDAAEEAQRKYNLNPSEAKVQVDRAVEDHVSRRNRSRKENELVAACFRAMSRFKRGEVGHEDVKRAYDAHNQYLADTGRAVRAMSVGTDSTGGYLSPELFSTQVYENLERYGVARRVCRNIQMTTEILRLPTATDGLTASVVSEAGTITASQPTFGQVTLQPKKLGVITNPFSDELLINAQPDVIPMLAEMAAIALAKQEDNNVFIGTSASYTGLLELTAVTEATSGTAISDTTLDDIDDVINALASRYQQNARFFWNKAVTHILRKEKANTGGSYLWGDATRGNPNTLWGYPFEEVVDMPSAPATNTAFGVFGDPTKCVFATRGPLQIDLLTEGAIGGVSLAQTAQYALRVMEYQDNAVLDTSAFCVIKTA